MDESSTDIKMDINHGIMIIGNEQFPKNEDIKPQHSRSIIGIVTVELVTTRTQF